MPSAAETVAAYGSAWNETDAAKRTALLETSWADDGLYVDPVSEGRGRAGLAEIITGFQKQAPGASIVITSGIDQHHNQIRFAWSLVQADGSTQITGIDAGELTADGRIARIVGYWGEPPALDARSGPAKT